MAWTDNIINIAGIGDDSIVDGPGIRVVLFAQGCPRRCEGCHNPSTHQFGVGIDYTVDELYERVKRNPLARGVTLSGGEPFSQAAAFARLAGMLRADGYELACYTGYTYEQLVATADEDSHRLLSSLDILIDGEFTLSQRNLDLRWRGSGNQRILDVPASLQQGAATPTTDERWL